MTYFIKKINVAVALLLASSLGSAYADYNSSACGQIDACCPCQPECNTGKGFFSADLLYWRAYENGLDTCVPTEEFDIVTPGGAIISTFKGKGRDPHFEWNPGFRIGTGYQFSNNWEIAVFWTHLNSHGHSSRDDDFSSSDFSSSESGSSSHNRWNLKYDVIDVVAGYDYDLGNCFSITPFAGIRLAKIDQKFRIGASPSSSFSSISSSFSSSFGPFSTIENKEKFRGLGPLVGVEGEWNIGCGFSIYAGASVSWLYGRFNVTLIEEDFIVGAADFCEVTKHLDANLAASDVGFGVRWSECLCGDTRLVIQLGLEHHRYYDYNRIGECCGDLSFDGLNLSAMIEF